MVSVRSLFTLSLVSLLSLNVYSREGGVTGDGGSIYDGKIADIYWQDSRICHIPSDAEEIQFSYANELDQALQVVKTIVDPKEVEKFNLKNYKVVLVPKLSGEDFVTVNGEVAKQLAFSYITCGAKKIKVIEVVQDFFTQSKENQIEIMAHEILHHATQSGHNTVSPIMIGLVTYMDLQARQKDQTKDKLVYVTDAELTKLYRMKEVLEDRLGSSLSVSNWNGWKIVTIYQFNKKGGGLVRHHYEIQSTSLDEIDFSADGSYVDTNSSMKCYGNCGENTVFIDSQFFILSGEDCSDNTFTKVKNLDLSCRSSGSVYSNINNVTKRKSIAIFLEGKNQILSNLSLDLKNCTTLIKGDDLDLSFESETKATTKWGCGISHLISGVSMLPVFAVNASACMLPLGVGMIYSGVTQKDPIFGNCAKPFESYAEKLNSGAIAGNYIKSLKDFKRIFRLSQDLSR
ncbi:MAG: hypothetical protein AB7I27_07855 [Bacteriovoracaceae bacterium]